MNNKVVMRAIERRMDYLFGDVWCNPLNKGKDLEFVKNELQELYIAFFELREQLDKVDKPRMSDALMINVISIGSLVGLKEAQK